MICALSLDIRLTAYSVSFNAGYRIRKHALRSISNSIRLVHAGNSFNFYSHLHNTVIYEHALGYAQLRLRYFSFRSVDLKSRRFTLLRLQGNAFWLLSPISEGKLRLHTNTLIKNPNTDQKVKYLRKDEVMSMNSFYTS